MQITVFGTLGSVRFFGQASFDVPLIFVSDCIFACVAGVGKILYACCLVTNGLAAIRPAASSFM